MTDRRTALRAAALLAAGLLWIAGPARAADVRVMISGDFFETFRELVPAFEQASGHKVIVISGASMGGAPDSIPARLARDEPADVIILAASGLEGQIKAGKAVAGSRVDLVRSSIGMAVKAGAPKPDISTVEALTKTLLAAKSIAYSASASGVYLSTELFPKLGIADRLRDTAKRWESVRIGAVVARGDAEIGFQQISEFMGIAGLDYVGPLPASVQRVTIFSAGIASSSKEPDAAKALIAFVASPAAAAAIARNGLEQVTGK